MISQPLLKKLRSLSFTLFLFFTATAQQVSVVPHSLETIMDSGTFDLSASKYIYYTGACKKEAVYLQQLLLNEYQLKLKLVEKKSGKPAAGNIHIAVPATKATAKEAYQLKIDANNITATGETAAGVFYAIQSLRQLIQKQHDKKLTLQCLTINDRPRFKWRAFMLDEGRYFKGAKVVKELLDEMALLKMNTFHWHLTDDGGWRIEIKKYPKLTEVGNKRRMSELGTWLSNVFDSIPHSGFYTQEEIKDIIQYAAERHINIIPEIEMPGHASAAIASYPWLGAENKPIEVPVSFGIKPDVFNVANSKVKQFLYDVLDEVMELFPSKIIHIGGDEVKYDQWKASAEVQAYMKANNIKTPADLQIAFTNGISQCLQQRNRRMIGWNDILGGLHSNNDSLDASAKEKLSPGTIIQFWTGAPEIVTQAALKGYDVVNSFWRNTYLDYDYTHTPLSETYDFNPVPASLPAHLHHKISGIGAQMWGEWIPTVERMNYLVYPRIAALAEVAWTDTTKKNFDRFLNALPQYLIPHWQKRGISILPEQMNRTEIKFIETVPRNYYLSATGNDNNDGLTKHTAWQSLKKINETDFNPGDSILLESSSVFKGNILLSSDDNGSLEKPVVITSYGTGKAVIDAGDADGLLAVNSSHIQVVSVMFKGSGVNSNKGSGIHFYSNDSLHAPSHVAITNCDVSGFSTYGVGFGCHDNPATKGYSNVRITHTNVTENGEGGIGSYGSHLGYQHHDFYIAYCKAYGNRGILSKTQNHSGNGIVMGMINGLLIEYCEAFENGADNRCTAGGPVGIWVWMCKNAIIQHCISHHNYAGLTKDGGGFDIDGGASDCILQYNYSYNNEGAGYLLAEYGAVFPFTNNTVRFNISINDGRKNGYGGIAVWGAAKEYSVTNTYIYNNTIFTDDKYIIDGKPAGITLMGPHFTNVIVANNIFATKGNVNLINADTAVGASTLLLLHNNYYSYTGQYFIQWQNKRFTSLQSWFSQNLTQEKWQGKSLWMNNNPLFRNQEIFTGKVPQNAGEYLGGKGLNVLPGSPLWKHLFPLGDHFNILSNTKDYCNRDLPADETVMPGACTQ